MTVFFLNQRYSRSYLVATETTDHKSEGLSLPVPGEKNHNSSFDTITHCHDKSVSELLNLTEVVQYHLNTAVGTSPAQEPPDKKAQPLLAASHKLSILQIFSGGLFICLWGRRYLPLRFCQPPLCNTDLFLQARHVIQWAAAALETRAIRASCQCSKHLLLEGGVCVWETVHI